MSAYAAEDKVAGGIMCTIGRHGFCDVPGQPRICTHTLIAGP